MRRRAREILVPASWLEFRFRLLDARCAEPGVDADALFFAPRNETAVEKEAREAAARAVCMVCPALPACREVIDRLEESRGRHFGLWAGENEKERQLRRRFEARVRRTLASALGVDEARVVPAARLAEDLGADSLDTVEILLALEAEFGMRISEAEALGVATVRQACDLVASKLGEAGPRTAAKAVHELGEDPSCKAPNSGPGLGGLGLLDTPPDGPENPYSRRTEGGEGGGRRRRTEGGEGGGGR